MILELEDVRRLYLIAPPPKCWSLGSFFGSMKTELDDRLPFETRLAAKNAVLGLIEGFYN